MANYQIAYRSGLGDFLDENSIDWDVQDDDEITVRLDDTNDLFRLGQAFEKWKTKHFPDD